MPNVGISFLHSSSWLLREGNQFMKRVTYLKRIGFRWKIHIIRKIAWGWWVNLESNFHLSPTRLTKKTVYTVNRGQFFCWFCERKKKLIAFKTWPPFCIYQTFDNILQKLEYSKKQTYMHYWNCPNEIPNYGLIIYRNWPHLSN